MTDVSIPIDAWDADGEGTIAAWLYAEGDHVASDVVIAELAVDKAALELRAPVAGRLLILVPAETGVRAGQIVARIVRE
jgi:pyruvate/2-oxoglutarate dehydrogenase complex dihydrolipoamide acyltransferase (E2) component